MATINPITPGLTPTAPGRTAATTAGGGSDNVPNSGKTMLLLEHSDSDTVLSLTIDSARACDQGSDHDVVVSLPVSTGALANTGGTAALHTARLVGPFPKARFDQADGTLKLTPGDTSGEIKISPFES